MKQNAIQFLFLLGLLLPACTPQAIPESGYPDLVLTNCVLRTPGIEIEVDAKCGSLPVSENPSDPQSRQITLNIALVPAVKRRAEPDPLFILVGGPGQSATEIFAALSSTLFRIHQERDIVLVDQRGTGKSNPLRCLDPKEDSLDDEQLVDRLKACPKTLDADLRYYTTDIAMQDLDRVRSSLGYEAINLYGISYGTRAALVYLKMYPGQVRSLILDAVVDPAFVLYQDAARDGQGSLDLFFQRCEADQMCSSTFPGLREEFAALLQELEKAPADVTIPHPITGKSLQFTVSATEFSNFVFSILYSPDLVSILPFAIHQAYAADNYAPLITQGYLVDTGIYDGLFYAVACAEDAPLVMREQAAEGIFGGNVQNFMDVCDAWPRGVPPTVVHEPVASNVPVLLLSGEADPITPPRHAESLRSSLPNSLHIIFPGMGHGNATSDCARRIMEDFIERASIADLDTSCAEEVEPPPFFVDFSGPQP